MIKKMTLFTLLLSILSMDLHANPNAVEFLNPPDQYKTGNATHADTLISSGLLGPV